MELATLTRGDGPVRIALVHGLGADGTTWIPFADELLAHVDATVIAPDLRGHGKSGRADEYSIDTFAQDLVDTLPPGLDVVMGHSLGGTVVERAIARLGARRAIYLDPGFKLALPTRGVKGRLFWTAPRVALVVSALATARGNKAARASYSAKSRELIAAAQERFERSMAPAVFKDIAFHPVLVGPPAAPSTILLTSQSAAVLPNGLAAHLEAHGWDIRRLPDLRHDAQLQDPAGTFHALADAFSDC